MAFSFAPPKFDVDSHGSPATSWNRFRDELNNYFVAADLGRALDERKIAILMYCLGPEYRTIFNGFDLTQADRGKFDCVIEKFNRHFEPKKLTKVCMRKFDYCMQGPKETFNEYMARLKELAESCRFGDSLEDQLVKQLSIGVRSSTLKERLWAEDLSLAKMVEKCQLWEQREATKDLVVSTPTQSASVSEFQARGRGRSQSRGQSRGRGRGTRTGWRGSPNQAANGRGFNPGNRGRGHQRQQREQHGAQQQQQRDQGQGHCSRCGKTHNRGQCPAFNEQCYECGGFGHYGRMCRKKSNPNKTVHSVETDSVPQESTSHDVSSYYAHNYSHDSHYDQSFVLHTHVEGQGKCNMWCHTIQVNSQDKIHFKIDTQGEVSVIPVNVYDAMRHKPELMKSSTVINGFGGAIVKPIGRVELPVKGKIDHVLCVEVVDGNVPCILSNNDSVILGLVKRVHSFEANVPESTRLIFDEFVHITEGVGCIPGHYSLKFDPSIPPVINPPRPISANLRDAVLSELNRMEANGIIAQVPVGTPTPWCSSLHVVLKKNNQVRITIDPRDLNKALLREHHPIATIDDVITRTHGAKYFSVLDARQGYFQIQLDEPSALITAFNTPFGRYHYKRLPMGITSAPEIYQRAMSDIFAGIQHVEIIMDDILIFGSTLDEHNKALRTVLQRCHEKNLKLNPDKVKLAQREVQYVGHKLTADGVKVADDKIQAVTEMPRPTDTAHVHTLLGMANYSTKFIPNLAAVTEPLRQIIKESKKHGFQFTWEKVHEDAFQELKRLLTTAPVLRYFNPKEPVVISCDASQLGVGMVLMQGDQPVSYASKALTSAEYAYSQIEKELMAIVIACKKFHTYIYGHSNVTVITDHLPLVRILEKPLHMVPLRLQKMRMRLQQYTFKLVHQPGKCIPVPDNLSRRPLPYDGPDEEFDVMLMEVKTVYAINPERMKRIVEENRTDQGLILLREMIMRGWPDQKIQVDLLIRQFWEVREELHVIDNIVLRNERIVVPATLRKEVLTRLHMAHQGMVRTKQLAKDLVFWPGMNNEIEELISKCATCQKHRNYQKKESLREPVQMPERPWSTLGADLFELNGSKFMVVVDYYSEWIEMEEMKAGTTATQVIEKMKRMFMTHGIPHTLITDNGPPFNSAAFGEFASNFNFGHVTMSPYHSQTNGLAERSIQTLKRLMIKCRETKSDFTLAMLNLRNTPTSSAGSPAQRLYGRRTRTLLPTALSKLRPDLIDPNVVTAHRTGQRITAKEIYDKQATDLTPLKIGDPIRMRRDKSWIPAKIIKLPTQQDPRSYVVETEQGTQFRRNRRDILKTLKDDFAYTENDDDLDVGQPTPNLPDPFPHPLPIPMPDPNPPDPNPPIRRSGRARRENVRLSGYLRY